MNSLSKLTMGAIGMSFLATIALSAPTFAQGAAPTTDPWTSSATATDAFAGQSAGAGAIGTINSSDSLRTGTQTQQYGPGTGLGSSPMLQGAANGTIAPQGAQATYVTGVNTAGTVRVNNLANLEALLNIIANGLEILGIAWGGPTMIMGFMHMAAGTQDAMKRVLFGAAGVTGGLATPGAINWLVASARDANLFS